MQDHSPQRHFTGPENQNYVPIDQRGIDARPAPGGNEMDAAMWIGAQDWLIATSITGTPWTKGVYDDWGVNLIVITITVLAVAACVMIHYEVLSWLSRRLGDLDHVQGRRRRRVLYGIFGVLSVHVVEIWIFGLVYYLLQVGSPSFGHIQGIAAASLIDHVYFSAVTFTTVGFGDVVPAGPIRFLAGTEALAGFVLITWSASFTYLEMNRFWHRD